MHVTLNQLFEAKAHLGHLPRYRHPKMAPVIFGQRNGVHMIDLGETQTYLEKALSFLRELGSRRGNKVLFVGTKRVCRVAIREHAVRAGMPYIDYRWPGGTITNYDQTTSKSIKTLKEMQQSSERGKTKKEISQFERKLEKLKQGVGGLENMVGLPDALFVVDVGAEKNAVREAKALKIPVIGVVDTNHSPEGIDYMIPGNDDGTASVELFIRLAADAIIEGRKSIVDIPQKETAPKPVITRVKKGPSDAVTRVELTSKPMGDKTKPSHSPQEK
jgi:small subunit ribosomal protein S2